MTTSGRANDAKALLKVKRDWQAYFAYPSGAYQPTTKVTRELDCKVESDSREALVIRSENWRLTK